MLVIILLIHLINQEVIEDNIRIEREHKKEIAAKKIPSKTEDKEAVLLAEEDISDRAPILESLIDKWKYFIKTKKTMLDRYIKNSNVINDSFEKMAKFLGADSFDSLPYILEKMETQMDSIEKFISQLSNLQNTLEEEKQTLERRIKELKVTLKQFTTTQEQSSKTSKMKMSFTETKTHNILKLKEMIKEM